MEDCVCVYLFFEFSSPLANFLYAYFFPKRISFYVPKSGPHLPKDTFKRNNVYTFLYVRAYANLYVKSYFRHELSLNLCLRLHW